MYNAGSMINWTQLHLGGLGSMSCVEVSPQLPTTSNTCWLSSLCRCLLEGTCSARARFPFRLRMAEGRMSVSAGACRSEIYDDMAVLLKRFFNAGYMAE